MTLQVDTVRYSGYDYTHDPAEIWRDKAACKGEDPQIFELIDMNLDGSDADKAILKQNDANFSKARLICLECPVASECFESATWHDLSWTVRGGETPKRFKGRTGGRPRKLSGEPCAQGHVDKWIPSGKNRRECGECKRTRTRERMRVMRAAEGKNPRLSAEESHKAKNLGHEPRWKGGNGKKECLECRNIRLKARRAAAGVKPRVRLEEIHAAAGHDHELKKILVGSNKRPRCAVCELARKRKKV